MSNTILNIDPTIFREYDIRGEVDKQLTPAFAELLGFALGQIVREGGGKLVVVGRDHRPSGVGLSNAMIKGLNAAGCDVGDIGITPTPVGYWTAITKNADAGVQITGSHNPPQYNGFKMTLKGGAFYGAEIQALRVRLDELAEQPQKTSADTINGKVHQWNVLADYLDDVEGRSKKAARPLKVVIDAGNGTGGMSALPLYERLGYTVIPLFCDPDGSFPNHHPDPTVEENLIDLRKAVAAHNADIGIAFDGDADRIGVIDRDGSVVWGDRLMIVLARAVLKEVPGAAIIGEVKCSKAMYDAIHEAGGKAVMWKAGHSLIKTKMKELDSPLAGEMSGHIFFKHRYYGFDDAAYAGARLLEILGESGAASIADLLKDVPEYVSTPEIRVDCPEEKKFALVDAVRSEFQKEAAGTSDIVNIVDVDGVRVEWADGWGLVRASNTQPILVLRFEADTESRAQEIESLFNARIEQARRVLL